jgi:hypothetical protein
MFGDFPDIAINRSNIVALSAVIGKDKCSEIGKKGYIKSGNNDAVKSATTVQ